MILKSFGGVDMGSGAGPVDTKDRLHALRCLMKSRPEGHLEAYLVPSEDAHQSEYVADCDRRREFISGFNGSAGLALVTCTKALLWTDGRYFLQASQQLSCDWQLMRAGEDPAVEDWIVKNLPSETRVGVDPTCISIDAAKRYQQAFRSSQIELTFQEENLVDQVWKSRPAPPLGNIAVHQLKFAGRPVKEKLAELRVQLSTAGARGIVVAALDEVAWLCNIRGNDVAYNPVTRSYGIVTLDAAFLYVDQRKLTPEASEYLRSIQVNVREYHEILVDTEALAAGTLKGSYPPVTAGAEHDTCVGFPEKDDLEQKLAIWLDPSSCSYAIYKRLRTRLQPQAILLQASPLALAKALKHPVELEGLRAAHVRDGAAVVAFLAWLDHQMQEQLGAPGYFLQERVSLKRKLRMTVVEENGKGGKHLLRPGGRDGEEELTEISAATKLEQLRSQQEHYVGLSFPTISSVGPHAAIIHYRPEEASCSQLDPNQIYLCDSGAQYRDGTTDVTRTVHFGMPTTHEKRCFTKVLKGHIMLDTAIFPNGTTGHVLDILARVPLWKDGLDYRHGTGHGVGSYLNVHEGPHLISFRPQARTVPLQANMTVTNEPGYYEDGNFGLRIENVMVVAEVQCKHNFGQKGYLGFESITWVPMQAKLMDVSIMTDSEKAWVDTYHARCCEKLAPLLSGPELEWLHKATEPLPR